MENYKKTKEDCQKKLDLLEKSKKPFGMSKTSNVVAGGIKSRNQNTSLGGVRSNQNKENSDAANKQSATTVNADEEEKNKLRSQISLLRS